MIKLKTQNSKLKTKNRRGMALLVVLFMIMAVVVISLGILYRSDMAAAGGHNYALRTQADYIAWAGLEHARAVILTEPNLPETYSKALFTLDDEEAFFYTLTIHTPDAEDPNSTLRHYPVDCDVYYNIVHSPQPRSQLSATVLYDPNAIDGPKAWFSHIARPVVQ